MDGNIYKKARRVAGMTQERWAEALGVAVDSIRRYENGERMPDDTTVRVMAELSGLTILELWHLRGKSVIAERRLPEVEHVPLPEAVIGLLLQVRELTPRVDALLEIAQDGQVTPDEVELYEQICAELGEVIRAAMAVRYAAIG